MDIAIIGNQAAQAGWTDTLTEGASVNWIQSPEEATSEALLIDLQFDGTEVRISQLQAHKGPVWVNDVPGWLKARAPFVRINGWNGFGKSSCIEAAAAAPLREASEACAAALGKTIEWLPDAPGFVTPRVIAMIINEAFHALSEGVSTPEEINTAMKLGTNYPMGPFEWAGQVGLAPVVALLEQLAILHPRYTPNALLQQQALSLRPS